MLNIISFVGHRVFIFHLMLWKPIKNIPRKKAKGTPCYMCQDTRIGICIGYTGYRTRFPRLSRWLVTPPKKPKKKRRKMREKNKTQTGKRVAKPDSSAVGKLRCHRVSESLWWQQGVSVARIWMGHPRGRG